jgi:hypothetical protein
MGRASARAKLRGEAESAEVRVGISYILRYFQGHIWSAVSAKFCKLLFLHGVKFFGTIHAFFTCYRVS